LVRQLRPVATDLGPSGLNGPEMLADVDYALFDIWAWSGGPKWAWSGGPKWAYFPGSAQLPRRSIFVPTVTPQFS
jgi:hypothetical protein